MPLYTVSSRAPIPDTTKRLMAKLIMDVHCGITGAPQTFVNVIFSEAVPLKRGIAYDVLMGVRKGRTGQMNNELHNTLFKEIVKLLDTSPQMVEMSMIEVPASWIMEGLHILPEPGEEDKCEWLKEGHG
ncbi:MAG: hypothetical protein MI867_20830 [Pseudomonadales bacterium]|nr:hypothetical protein [Pseudomonadales bacterium]